MSNGCEPHAMSRYTGVTEPLIEKCQRAYLSGRDLKRPVAGLSDTEFAIVVVESLEGDRLLHEPLPPKELVAYPLETMSDWGLAVLAEMLFGMADQARAMGVRKDREQAFRDRAWAALEQALDSPTASPMLWYEDIYLDVAQEYWGKDNQRATELMKRGLAHDLHYHEGINASSFLRDLAHAYMQMGELDQGLAVFAVLLRNTPADIWLYNVIALTFGRLGLADLGIGAVRRGLELIEATGDPEKLHDQFISSLESLRQGEERGREAGVNPAVLTDFRAALVLDFDAGQHRPTIELCRELVPDLDRVPVKTPPEMPDLPPPLALDRGQRPSRPARDPGRNDPCWCGSGKKYKHCHMWSDRRKRS